MSDMDKPTFLLLRLCREKWGASVGTWKWVDALNPKVAKGYWAALDGAQKRAARKAKLY